MVSKESCFTILVVLYSGFKFLSLYLLAISPFYHCLVPLQLMKGSVGSLIALALLILPLFLLPLFNHNLHKDCYRPHLLFIDPNSGPYSAYYFYRFLFGFSCNICLSLHILSSPYSVLFIVILPVLLPFCCLRAIKVECPRVFLIITPN